MNQVEVLEKMEPILSTQVRTVDHNPRTRVTVTPDNVVFRPGQRSRHMVVTEEGTRSMARYVGLPEVICRHLEPQTFGQVATELLAQKRRYALVVKDGDITGIVKPGEYRTLQPERVLRAIEKGVPDIDYHRVLITPDFIASLEVVGERRQPVRQGDLVQAGAMITFSPMGAVNPTVQSYALRLFCTNGMTSNTVLREFSYAGGGGEGDDIWQWFRRSAAAAYGALDAMVSRYRQMIDENIPPEERAQRLEALIRAARITGETANAVRGMAIDNPPENSYDMMNLITNATSHLIQEPERVRRAQQLIAEHTTTAEHSLECPMCHHRRN